MATVADPSAQRRTGSGFMSTMSELRAGPSQEQRRHAEELRANLLADLEKQVGS